MSPTPNPSSDAPWPRPLYEHQAAALGRLADVGVNIALAIEAHVTTVAAEAPTPEVSVLLDRAGLAYARVARAVRLSFRGQTQAIEAIDALDHPQAKTGAGGAGSGEPKTLIIKRIIVDPKDPGKYERLEDEARERGDRDDLAGLVRDRPAGELVAMICRELGLDPDWPRRVREAWARGETVSGAMAPSFADYGGEDLQASPFSGRPAPPAFAKASAGPPPSLPSGGPRSGATRGGEDFRGGADAGGGAPRPSGWIQ